MVDIGVKIKQSGREGDPGESRSDLILGAEVTLSNNDAGVDTWRWEIINKPRTSSVVLTHPVPGVAIFTPDVVGSYLIQLTINGRVKQRVVAAVLTTNLGIRIPAIGEANEFEGGWAQAIIDALEIIEANAPAVLVSISVTTPGGVDYVGYGGTEQMAATGTYSDGSTQDLTGVVFWTTSNLEYIEVDAYGLIYGETLGTSAIITASLGPINGSKQMSCVSF